MNKLTVSVTKKHITKGKIGRSLSCPISLALKDAGFINPSVGCRTVALRDRDVSLPIEASNFIFSFDGRRGVKPFTFELDMDNEPQ